MNSAPTALREPVETGGGRVETVIHAPAIVRDLRAAGRGALGADAEFRLFVNLCEVEPEVLDAMNLARQPSLGGSAWRPTQSFRSPRRSTAQTPSRLPAAAEGLRGFHVPAVDIRSARALVAHALHQPLSEIDALDPADLAELAEDAGEILRAAAGTR